jgi:putative peptide zinc metalloprotease protein
MVTLADSLISSSSRRLPLRMRPDLSVRYHRYQGRPYWVIKEPIGLKYYRFQEEEYSILRMLDGECSFDEIKQRFEREYAPQKISLQDLQHFIGMLHRSGLLVTDAEGQGMQLRKRRSETLRREWMSTLSNVLAIRFKGIDPDRILNWLAPWTNWFFTKWAAMFFGTLGLAALLLVGVKFEEFRLRLPAFHEFFGPENWFWLGITLALTKVLHEFGHGLSCKRFGGECHEIGVMILVLTPCLYCNVSDSWLLPNKWHRAVIGAAGMYVEVVLASIATFLWWFSEPGLLNHICLSIMFICSVSTVLFNGNPLLRFDGYYILSDIAEIPNLRQKSSKILQRIMSEWCLGIEQQEDPFLPQGNQWFFALYTIAAVVYRWVVVLSIFLFLNKVLEPYGLKVIGQVIAMAGLVGLVVQPAWQFGKFLHTPGRMHQVKRKNLLTTVVVVGALIAAFLYVPLPYSVKCALEVQPRNATTVYALVPGILDELHIEAGQHVTAGDDVAQLSNEDFQLTVIGLEQKVSLYQRKMNVLQHSRYRSEAAELWAQLPELQTLLNSSREQLAKAKEDLAKLQVKASASGTIMPPPNKKPPSSGGGQLPSWKGSLLDPENSGASLQSNDELCRIGDPNHFEALMAVDQADINSIHAGQKVRIKLDAYSGDVFEAVIESEQDISRKPMPFSPESMAVQAGGALATQTDASGAPRPISATYQVKVPLPEGMRDFKIGQRGRAKISAAPQSVGQRFWRFITRTFHFEL